MNQLHAFLCLVLVFVSCQSVASLDCYNTAAKTTNVTCNATAGETECVIKLDKATPAVYGCGKCDSTAYVAGQPTRCCSGTADLSNKMACAVAKVKCYTAANGAVEADCAWDVQGCKNADNNGTKSYACATGGAQGCTAGTVGAVTTCCYPGSSTKGSNNATCEEAEPTVKPTKPKSAPANAHVASLFVTVGMIFIVKMLV